MQALVIEKTDTVGGSTAMSGGVLWLPNNPVPRRAGVQDSPEDARRYFASAVGDVGPPRRRCRAGCCWPRSTPKYRRRAGLIHPGLPSPRELPGGDEPRRCDTAGAHLRLHEEGQHDRGPRRSVRYRPAGPRATADRHNASAAHGKDPDCHKGERAYDRYYGDPRVSPNPCVAPVGKAPFYAVALYPDDVGTAGGLLTDEHARVMREDGEPIPGLYATGNRTASVMGRTYPGGRQHRRALRLRPAGHPPHAAEHRATRSTDARRAHRLRLGRPDGAELTDSSGSPPCAASR
ncbi:FAD-binding protein [Streptomyces sp. NPDC005803]|uniref:FAD-binding protein n=1 Tax=Streptomyces sp. NPDC005803 TaxID=3154297 RepID=UPI0033CD78C3